MRTRILPGARAVPALLALAPVAAAAQTIPSHYTFVETRQEAGVFAGYTRLAKGRFGFGPAGGATVGARWGVVLSGPLGFETVATLIEGSRPVVDPGRVEGDRVVGDVDQRLGSLDARLSFTLTGDRAWHGFAPFIFLGGGVLFDLSGPDPTEEELPAGDRFDFGSSFLGTLGTGTRWYVSDGLVLRGDATFSLHKIGTPPGFSDPERGIEGVEENEWVSGLQFTLAVLIPF